MRKYAKIRRDIGIKQRYYAETRFRFYSFFTVGIALFFLWTLLWSIISQGYTAFWQTSFSLSIHFDSAVINKYNNKKIENPPTTLLANYQQLVRNSLAKKLSISLNDTEALREIDRMVSPSVRMKIRRMIHEDPLLIDTTQNITFLASADIDSAFKGQFNFDIYDKNSKISNRQIQWMHQLASDGTLFLAFNKGLFFFASSSRPETSGLGVALIGSFYMMVIVLLASLPIGVATAVYLEEYARRSLFTDLIEVNINNLAAVPSIVFGLLGLIVFINFFELPRSASLIGGLVLALITLPTIIISTRSALRAIPYSIRAAALGLGASKTQMIFHHILPLSAPGILTGTIIGLANALGETAPLLLIGMVAFVANYPVTPMDPATALPVQIFMWANEAERAFVERSSAGIIVLLSFLTIMNVTAIFLRRRFKRRW